MPFPSPADSGRGAVARERMLKAALDLFGRHGFEATTTRMIAQAASVNLGAIAYYFGSKDALHAQAGGYLASFIENEQRAPLHAFRTHVAQTNYVPELIDLAANFLLAQARLLFADKVPASWIQFYLRSQAEHGVAFDRIFARAVEPVQVCMTEVVARIMALPVDDFRARAFAFVVVHQFVCLRLAESVLMRRLNWSAITAERVEQLLAVIGPSLRAQLASVAHTPYPS
ncbi:MAG: CerR family C-terminal domain-containing protein [Aquabacterium sp.]|nr:CerR family C-terminal domain-containing protein [Aquabacterium sp.]